MIILKTSQDLRWLYFLVSAFVVFSFFCWVTSIQNPQELKSPLFVSEALMYSFWFGMVPFFVSCLLLRALRKDNKAIFVFGLLCQALFGVFYVLGWGTFFLWAMALGMLALTVKAFRSQDVIAPASSAKLWFAYGAVLVVSVALAVLSFVMPNGA